VIKKCIILHDEISIMTGIEYNKSIDLIEGFEDLGPLGRTSKVAKHALVIMVRGLYKNWKFPLCYFLANNGVSGNNLNILIKESVKCLLDVGLLPTAIVCDQGTQNQKLFTLLGGTEVNPITEIHGKKIHLLYDIPHLIKSLRNNLITGNIQIKNEIISFGDVIKTYEIDMKNNTARAMCKLSSAHISPNPFQKMSCKLAIQIFSNSVSAAIKTCIQTGELRSNTAKDTADFLFLINNAFDACNSKNLYDINPNRRTLSPKNENIFETIKKTISEFQDAKKISHKDKKVSIPPCFKGMIWSLTSILNLYESELLDFKTNIQPQNNSKEYF